MKQWFHLHFLFDSEYIKTSVVANWWLKSVDKPTLTWVFFSVWQISILSCKKFVSVWQMSASASEDFALTGGDDGDAVVTNDWCINCIRPSIYSKLCRNRQDSPFAASSPSTDTPKLMSCEKKHMNRLGLDPWTPRRPSGLLSARSTRTTRKKNKGSQSENFSICLGPLVTTQVNVKMAPLSITIHQCYQQQPVCWADSEFLVSRCAERRGRPIDCVYLQVHFIIFFVSKKWFSTYFFSTNSRLLGGV